MEFEMHTMIKPTIWTDEYLATFIPSSSNSLEPVAPAFSTFWSTMPIHKVNNPTAMYCIIEIKPPQSSRLFRNSVWTAGVRSFSVLIWQSMQSTVQFATKRYMRRPKHRDRLHAFPIFFCFVVKFKTLMSHWKAFRTVLLTLSALIQVKVKFFTVYSV